MITHVKAPEGITSPFVTSGKVYALSEYRETPRKNGRIMLDDGISGLILVEECAYIEGKDWIVVDSDGEVV